MFNISGESLSTAEKLEGVFLSDFSNEKVSIGGPIINYSGQTIGMTGSVSKNGKIEYFQIPSNKIKKVLDKVIEKKIDSNPIFGAYYKPINKSYSLVNGLDINYGAMIYSKSGQNGLAVIAKTPAAKAGLKINDIITKIGENEITLLNNFSNLLYNYKKGDMIEVTILRDKKEMKISVQL
jgi:S1-C subfamily serine protease